MDIEVKVISKETIKPSYPTPGHLRHYSLSFLDQSASQFFMPWVLFYHKDTNTELNNLEQRERIKKSLSEALTQFYPLAGRVKENLYIECNDVGVNYVDAVAKCNLSEFLENLNPCEHKKFVPHELDPMSSSFKVIHASIPSSDLVSKKVTKLKRNKFVH